MKTKIPFFGLVILFSFWSVNLSAQPLQITIHKQPPHLPHFDNFDDVIGDVFISVVNTSNVEVEYNLKIHATGPNGLVLDKENFLDVPLTIAANSARNFTGEDWDGSGANITEDDVLPESERQFLRLNRVFREGEYCICLTAIVPDHPEQELSIPTDGCDCFAISYSDAPVIEIPDMNQVLIPLDPPLVNIAWSHSVPGAPSLFDYTLKVIDITAYDGVDPVELMEQPSIPVVFEEEETGLLMKGLTDVDFEEGHLYATRVTVTDPDGETYFKNNGKSNVVVFRYGQDPDAIGCDDLSTYSVEAHFPLAGDTIPFTMFPLVVDFEPGCPEYWRFEQETDFNGHTQSGHNVWPNGALEYTQSRYGDESIGWDQASKLPVYDVSGVQRGQSYYWSSNTVIKKRNGENWSSSVPNTSFVVGMPQPRLTSPTNNDTVAPGSIHFQWSIGSGQSRLIPEYKLTHFTGSGGATETRMSDVDERWVLQIFSANEANAENLKHQQSARIQVAVDNLYSNYRYDEAKLQLLLSRSLTEAVEITAPGEYWWRVVWLKNPSSNPGSTFVPETDVYHGTSLRRFVISTEAPVEESSGECISGAEAPAITDHAATSGLVVGDKLKIGLFELEVTSISSEAGSQFSGEGEIKVGFLGDLRVAVVFTNIRKNAANQIFSGTVKAKEDRTFSTSGVTTSLGSALGMSQETASQLDDYLGSGERLLSALTGNRAIGMPIGIDNEVEGNTFVVGILEMIFTPEHASLKAVVNLDIPSLDDYYLNRISLGVSDVLFSPQGLGSEGKAFLPREHRLAEADGSEMVLGGLENAGSDWRQVTYVEWDCHGFKCLNVAIDFKFSRDVIVPDTPDGSPGTGQVIAHTNLKMCDGFDLMARVDFPAFQVADAPDGFAFEVDEAWLDLSSAANPDGFMASLPANYVDSHLNASDARQQNLWKGFWLKDLKLRIPEYAGNLEGEEERTMSVAIHNFIYDGAFTFSFRVQNVLSLTADHNVEGSAFSIDTVYMDVLQNAFEQAGMKGKIGLPIADNREYLNYKLIFDHDSSGDTLQFVVEPQDSLTIPILIAKAHIAPTSNFKLTILPSVEFSFDINALVSLSENNTGGADSGALSMNAPGIKIEHLAYSTRTGFDSQRFSFSQASPQKSMSGFPLSLDTMFFSLSGFNPSLSIKPRLTIMSGSDGVSAAAQITIVAGLETNADGEKKIKLTDVNLDAINLDVAISTLRLSGELEFYKTDTDKGTRGRLQVALPAGIEVQLSAEFGARKMPGATVYGSAQWFDYWYVDGMATFGRSGVTVFSGLQLYGLGGGVYHNMTRSGAMPLSGSIDPGTNETPTNQPSSGLTYTPSYDTGLGLKFTALFGSPGGGGTYNFDVSLLAEFDRSGGMTLFGFKGNVRVLADDLADRDVPVSGYVSVEYHNPSNTADGEEHVEGDLFVVVDFLDIVKGAGDVENPPADYTGPRNNAFVWASFYAAMNRDYWYYNMGTPENRGGLKVTLGGTDLLTFTSYLMIGHDIPTTLPPPSDAFMNIYRAASGDFTGGGDVSSLMGGRARPALPLGTGFAFGSAFSLDLDMTLFPFYMDIDMAMGFDINMTHSLSRTCAEFGENPEVPEHPGKNGWYATGQFYAGIRGEFGLEVDLWFISGKFPIFDAAAALVMQGGIPNPNWATGDGRIAYRILGGLFKGSYHFEAELGNKCTPTASSSDLLSELDIIQDLKPTGNDVDVYAVGSAAFAIGVNEILEVPVSDTEIRRFRPFISDWYIKENNRTKIALHPFEMDDDNVSATIMPQSVFRGHTNYKQYIEVKAYELFTNRPQKLVKNDDDSDWKDYKYSDFRTGAGPVVIEDDNVLFSYPLPFQKHFLKGETEGGKGYIVQRQGTPSVFPGYGAQEFNEFDYIARFIPITGADEESTDVPLEIQDYRIIKFDVSSLANDRAYCVQIIQKKRVESSGSPLANLSVANQNVVNIPIHNALNVQQAYLLGNQLTSDVIKRRRLPGTTTRNPNEKLLYKYYFKTSEFNTFRAKAGHENWNPDFKNSFLGEMVVFSSTWDENPERFDRYGYTKMNRGGRFKVKNLIGLYVNSGASELDDAGFPEYPRNPYLDVVASKITIPFMLVTRTLGLNRLPVHHRQSIDYSKYLYLGGSMDESLSISELNRINNPPTSHSSPFHLGATNFNFAGGAFNEPLLTVDLTQSVEVTHAMHIAGAMDMMQTKSANARNIYTRLPSLSLSEMMSASRPPWLQKYVDRYGRANAYNVIRSAPRVIDFLDTFYSTGHPSVASSAYLLAHGNVDDMRYPRQGHRLKPVSFIMSYQYPASNSPVSGTAIIKRGTHFRVHSGYLNP